MACCCQPRQPRQLNLKLKQPEGRFGMTVPFLGTLYETMTFMPTPCSQTFIGSPTSMEPFAITPDDKIITAEYLNRTRSSCYIHCPLQTNLSRTNCWPSLGVLRTGLQSIYDLPAACVLHVGRQGSLETVAQNLNRLQQSGHLRMATSDRVPFPLLLEIAAGQKNELGRSWEEIRHLYEGLDTTRVGLCVDTQHAFAAGMCSFQTHEDVVKLFDAASYILPKGISMIHLNDSTKAFGSRVDRHAPLRQGFIWSESDEGLRSLVTLSRDHALDLVSETRNPIHDAGIVQGYLDLSDS